MTTAKAALVSRWFARVWSLLSILIILMLAIGESVGSKGRRPTSQEWLGLALWPIGAIAGLVVAWFREELGGIIAIACLAGFYAWNLLHSGFLPRGPFFLLFTAPAFLFLAAGLLSRHETAQHI